MKTALFPAALVAAMCAAGCEEASSLCAECDPDTGCPFGLRCISGTCQLPDAPCGQCGGVTATTCTADDQVDCLRANARLYIEDGGRINGIPLPERGQRALTLLGGAPLRGNVRVRSIKRYPERADLPVIFLASWQPAESYVVLNEQTVMNADGEPVTAWQIEPEVTYEFQLPEGLTTPTEPGPHYLLFASGPQTHPHYIASGTFWPLGAPRWGDGNDLNTLFDDEPMMPHAASEGYARVPMLSQEGLECDVMGLSWLRIDVRSELPPQ